MPTSSRTRFLALFALMGWTSAMAALANTEAYQEAEGDKARITIDCRTPNTTCGHFEWSAPDCQGELTYLGKKRGGHEFRERSKAGKCPTACTLWMADEGDYYLETCGGKITRRGKLAIPEQAAPPPDDEPAIQVPADTPVITISAGETTYIGRFLVDKETGNVNGSGRIEWKNGDHYEGQVRNSRRHGQGSFHWASGDRYSGELRDDEFHGQGTYLWKNGNRYQGTWQHGKKHGPGRTSYPDGSYWEGEFSNNQQTENGKMVVGGALPGGKK